MKHLEDYDLILMKHRRDHPEDRDEPDWLIIKNHFLHHNPVDEPMLYRLFIWLKNFWKCVWNDKWLNQIGERYGQQ